MGTLPKTAIPSAILDLLFGPVTFSDFSTSIVPSSSLCATFLYPDKLRSVHRFKWTKWLIVEVLAAMGNVGLPGQRRTVCDSSREQPQPLSPSNRACFKGAVVVAL